MIKKLRVDYRLVHGQVAISWSRALGVDCILVANDEVAKDEMRQSMLRISKPQGNPRELSWSSNLWRIPLRPSSQASLTSINCLLWSTT